MLLPPLTRAKLAARGTVCKSDMRQVQLGFHLYQDDNQERGYPRRN